MRRPMAAVSEGNTTFKAKISGQSQSTIQGFIRFLVPVLLILVSLLNSVAGARSRSHTPKTLMKKSTQELQTILASLDHQLNKIQKDEGLHEEERLVKAMARDMVDHAYREKNSELQQKELSMGVQLINHPKEQMDLLRKETKTKQEAMRLLEEALKSDDPDRQEVLINDAEKMIYWLETGKELEKKPIVIPSQPAVAQPDKASAPAMTPAKPEPAKETQKIVAPADANPTAKPQAPKIDQSARDRAYEIAVQLIQQSKNETDATTKKELIEDAYKLTHEPELHLKPYLIKFRTDC